MDVRIVEQNDENTTYGHSHGTLTVKSTVNGGASLYEVIYPLDKPEAFANALSSIEQWALENGHSIIENPG